MLFFWNDFVGVDMPSVTIVEQNQTRLPIFALNVFISSSIKVYVFFFF